MPELQCRKPRKKRGKNWVKAGFLRFGEKTGVSRFFGTRKKAGFLRFGKTG